MARLIFIDATMREGSRTRRIARPIIDELGKRYEIETIRLDGAGYPAVDSRILHDRDNGIVPEEYADMARSIAAADRIVIAAPITFDSDDTRCYGLCKCEKLLYITTRGMNIRTGDPLEQATPYLRALSVLWGLGELYVISAENMDYSTEDVIEKKITDAVASGLELCRDF